MKWNILNGSYLFHTHHLDKFDLVEKTVSFVKRERLMVYFLKTYLASLWVTRSLKKIRANERKELNQCYIKIGKICHLIIIRDTHSPDLKHTDRPPLSPTGCLFQRNLPSTEHPFAIPFSSKVKPLNAPSEL